MNKQRRERIRNLIEQIEDLETAIDEVLCEEQDCFDNLPENFQDSERGENMQEAINSLEEAISCIDDCVSNLESALEY